MFFLFVGYFKECHHKEIQNFCHPSEILWHLFHIKSLLETSNRVHFTKTSKSLAYICPYVAEIEHVKFLAFSFHNTLILNCFALQCLHLALMTHLMPKPCCYSMCQKVSEHSEGLSLVTTTLYATLEMPFGIKRNFEFIIIITAASCWLGLLLYSDLEGRKE